MLFTNQYCAPFVTFRRSLIRDWATRLRAKSDSRLDFRSISLYCLLNHYELSFCRDINREITDIHNRLYSIMELESPQQVLGVQELYRPTHEPTEIDSVQASSLANFHSDLSILSSIVAVHGLNGDAVKSWTSNNICWLKHPNFLPKYIGRARVLTWGYNANISSLTGNTTSSDRILQHAHTLVGQLQGDTEVNDVSIQTVQISGPSLDRESHSWRHTLIASSLKMRMTDLLSSSATHWVEL